MFSEKARYFFWALSSLINRDLSCPFCNNNLTHLLLRKKLVTTLWECENCGLRFRRPKGNQSESFHFYQNRYKEEFTTDCPTDEDLNAMLTSNFANCDKNYTNYIEVLKAAGLCFGDSILDFGCSWGYGSWLIQKAGFNVYSYDISKPRITYAQNKLGCQIVPHLRDIPEKLKCFFSAHVIEHLDDPNIIWEAAIEVLDQRGMMVCFCPNGDPDFELVIGSQTYHKLWGKKHPLLITRKSLKEMSNHYGFSPYIFSSPYSFEEIRSLREPSRVTGPELLLIAIRY